jgi:hypothetical protein
MKRTEPELVKGAQESIPRNRLRQAGNRFLGLLKRFKNSGSKRRDTKNSNIMQDRECALGPGGTNKNFKKS